MTHATGERVDRPAGDDTWIAWDLEHPACAVECCPPGTYPRHVRLWLHVHEHPDDTLREAARQIVPVQGDRQPGISMDSALAPLIAELFPRPPEAALRRGLAEIQAELKAGLDVKLGPEGFILRKRPTIRNGIVMPAACVATEPTCKVEYTTARSVDRVRTTERAVGFFTSTRQWVVLWVGDDKAERDIVLQEFLAELGRHQR